MRKFVEAEENDLFVNAMLNGNEVIEEALAAWRKDQKDVCAMLAVYKSLLDRDRECGGLILSVEPGDIPAGADNIEFFNGDKHLCMNRSKGQYGDNYLVVFTSRERFQEHNDTAGVVMFIRELFSTLGNMEGVDGIVMNLSREEVVFDKSNMLQLCRMMEVSEETK